MKNHPLVSVIIPVYNSEKYLAETLDSVFAQTYHPIEVIVVDGCSTDNTAQIAKSYHQVCYLQQQGTGLANARNTGIDTATGELLAFLDSDDYWRRDKLAIQIESSIQNPEIEYSYANLKLFLEPGCELRYGFDRQQFDRVQIGRTPGTLVARKSLFDRIGKFNPNFTIGCDVEWFTRAKDYKIAAAVVPQVLLYKRVHDTNLSSNVKTNREELLTVIKQSLHRQRQLMMVDFHAQNPAYY
jgi:glycosyltransferase involved in cell wall biosynthesis